MANHLKSAFDASEEGGQYVLQLLDYLEQEGPNGRYLCVVTEVLGPSLAVDIEELWYNEGLPPGGAGRFIGQIALGVRYLHRRGVVYGDPHRGNLLLFSPQITS